MALAWKLTEKIYEIEEYLDRLMYIWGLICDKSGISVPRETNELVNELGGSWTGGSPFGKQKCSSYAGEAHVTSN